MKQETWNIFGVAFTVVPFIILLLKLFVTEFVSNLAKSIFNTKSKAKTDSAVTNTILILFLIAGLFFIIPRIIPSTVTNNVKTTNIVQPKKTDAQVAAETGVELLNKGLEIGKKQHEKNKIAKANRENKYVYQIGYIKDDDEVVLEAYKKIVAVPGINKSRIFVFQIKRREYFIFYNEELSKDQIESGLDGFKSKIAYIEPAIKIVDLMSYCRLRQDIAETDVWKFRKAKVAIPVCSCD